MLYNPLYNPLRITTAPISLLARGARLAGFAGIAAITVLSLLPGAERPHTGLPGQAEHFTAYACTGFALSFGCLRLRERLVFLAVLAAASVGFEILQQWIPGRGCEIEDAVASSLGAAAGLALGALAAARLYAGLPAENPEEQSECGAE